MELNIKLIKCFLIFCMLPVLGSCIRDDLSQCAPAFRLEYRYERTGIFGNNELGYYVGSLREYVFDGRDILVAVNDYNVPRDNSSFFSRFDFTPGRYTVISFGNESDYEETERAVIGETSIDDMLIYIHNPQDIPDISDILGTRNVSRSVEDVQDRSDRLYYGYRKFEVTSADNGRRVSMDMTHAHCVLDVRVKWLDNTGHPVGNGNYFMTLKHAPSCYRFSPEFLVYNGSETGIYSSEDEAYSVPDAKRVNYIPSVVSSEQVCYAIRGSVVPDRQRNLLYGQFVTFRFRGDSEILFCVYSGSERVMKEIDLNRFFHEMGIDLHYELWQEYNIQIEINGDEVRVSFVEVDDWTDGGPL